jgi:hypothetical protein
MASLAGFTPHSVNGMAAGFTPHSVGDLAYPLPTVHVMVQTEWDDEWFISKEWRVRYVAEDLPQLDVI